MRRLSRPPARDDARLSDEPSDPGPSAPSADLGSDGASSGELDGPGAEPDHEAATHLEGPALDGDQPGSTLGVLIVDDEPVVRTLLRAVIERDDRFEVAGEAMDGEEAVELAEQLQPDVVLLDLLMPRMGGREALPAILRVSPTSMVLVLSALRAVDEAETTFAAGAFAYLEKSVMGPGLAEELYSYHERFKRAVGARETVWAPNDPMRVRR